MSSWIGSVGVTPIVCVFLCACRISPRLVHRFIKHVRICVCISKRGHNLCVFVSRVFASRVICVNSTVPHCCVAIVRCQRFAYFQIAASILCVDESCTWLRVS